MTDVATTDGWTDPLANPGKANQTVDKVLKSTEPTVPTIPFPPDDLVELPGGLVKGDKVYNTAVVRELTGEHEEQLARSAQSGRGNGYHFIDTLLECGTVSIGDAPTKDTKKLLKELLVGDREALILGIRRATYGDSVEIKQFMCPSCRDLVDLDITLDDIEISKLDNPREETKFEVALRKGGHALVRLPTGADQSKIYENPNNTMAQVDTILLSNCVLEVVDPNGTVHNVAAWPKKVLEMSIPDRRNILKEIVKRQPGPRYNEIKFTHEACGNEVSLPLGVGDLFLDL